MNPLRKASLQPLTLVTLVLAAGSLVTGWFYAGQALGSDFYTQPWLVTQALKEIKPTNIYSREDRRRLALYSHWRATTLGVSQRHKLAAQSVHHPDTLDWGTTGTPFLFTVFSVLQGVEYDTAWTWYRTVSLALLAAGVLVTGLLLRYSLAAALTVLTLVTFTTACYSELRVLNVNMIQVGMLALVLGLLRVGRRYGHALGGAALAAAILFKPNLALAGVLMAVGWLFSRRYRKLLTAAAGGLAGAALVFVVSSIYLGGFDAWPNFIRSLTATLAPADFRLFDGNYTFVQAIREWFAFDARWLVLGVLVVPALALLWLRRRHLKRREGEAASQVDDRRLAFEEDVLGMGLGCAITIAASPLAWLHYYLLLAPLVLFLLRPLAAAGAGQERTGSLCDVLRVLAAGLGLVLLMTPMSMIGGALQWNTMHLVGPLIGLTALLAAGYMELWRLGRVQEAKSEIRSPSVRPPAGAKLETKQPSPRKGE